eukprot:4554466-Pleurochrysis_carterae.AAC.1
MHLTSAPRGSGLRGTKCMTGIKVRSGPCLPLQGDMSSSGPQFHPGVDRAKGQSGLYLAAGKNVSVSELEPLHALYWLTGLQDACAHHTKELDRFADRRMSMTQAVVVVESLVPHGHDLAQPADSNRAVQPHRLVRSAYGALLHL